MYMSVYTQYIHCIINPSVGTESKIGRMANLWEEWIPHVVKSS